MNNVSFVGRLTKDPELKTTDTGRPYALSTLAVNRNFKNGNGEYETDYIPLTIWGKLAETFADYARKGSLISVTGEIRTHSYEKDGVTHFSFSTLMNSFRLLEAKKKDKQDETTDTTPEEKTGTLADLGLTGTPLDDITDDDLPF